MFRILVAFLGIMVIFWGINPLLAPVFGQSYGGQGGGAPDPIGDGFWGAAYWGAMKFIQGIEYVGGKIDTAAHNMYNYFYPCNTQSCNSTVGSTNHGWQPAH